MQLKTVLLGLFLLLIQTREEARTLSLLLPAFQVKTSDYVGTWVGYTANGSEFKIVLREQKKFKLPTGQFYDVVVGNHSFLNKETALKNESLSKTEDEFVLFGIPALSDSGGLDMTFRDRINHKAVFVTVSFVGGNAKSLH